MERDGLGGCGVLPGIRGGGRCVSEICLPATVSQLGFFFGIVDRHFLTPNS